jgi:heme iron utilization protein
MAMTSIWEVMRNTKRDQMSEADQKTKPTFDPVRESRHILSLGRTGALATLTPDGAPLTTLVTFAPLIDSSPVFLMSRLSAHTQNLLRDTRASLLVSKSGKGDPLAHPRISLNGHIVEVTDTEAKQEYRARFLARHPKAKLYVDFGDFSFWKMAVADVHFNGGFAKAAHVRGDEFCYAANEVEAFIGRELDIMSNINKMIKDNPSKLGLDNNTATIIGFDPDGIDFFSGDEIQRLSFKQKAIKAEQLYEEINQLGESSFRAE